jgi:hypothetical protein
VFVAEESTAASSADVEECYTYESGPFVGTINCAIDNFASDTCTLTIDGVECNSCAIATYSATDAADMYGENYVIDCSKERRKTYALRGFSLTATTTISITSIAILEA